MKPRRRSANTMISLSLTKKDRKIRQWLEKRLGCKIGATIMVSVAAEMTNSFTPMHIVLSTELCKQPVLTKSHVISELKEDGHPLEFPKKRSPTMTSMVNAVQVSRATTSTQPVVHAVHSADATVKSHINEIFDDSSSHVWFEDLISARNDPSESELDTLDLFNQGTYELVRVFNGRTTGTRFNWPETFYPQDEVGFIFELLSDDPQNGFEWPDPWKRAQQQYGVPLRLIRVHDVPRKHCAGGHVMVSSFTHGISMRCEDEKKVALISSTHGTLPCDELVSIYVKGQLIGAVAGKGELTPLVDAQPIWVDSDKLPCFQPNATCTGFEYPSTTIMQLKNALSATKHPKVILETTKGSKPVEYATVDIENKQFEEPTVHLMVNQLVFKPSIENPGDSGAVLWTETKAGKRIALGMVVGGTQSYSVITPIRYIIDHFGKELKLKPF